ncbi:FAD/NAD(P)-binding domain-containing protein [Trametes polyzona]|nr:FAD/NAD(P)-binding domain-containing protein [Trametes polyzona]
MSSYPSDPEPTRGPVAVIGAGVAGLVTAHTLIRDGFTDVQVLTRDNEVGGIWAASRIYPGLYLNKYASTNRCTTPILMYRFSSLEMPPPSAGGVLRGRLSGAEMSQYFETFAETFLKGHVRLGQDVRQIRRHPSGKGWLLEVYDIRRGVTETKEYRRVVLCTGGCTRPKIPEQLHPRVAATAGFTGPVIHSSDLAEKFREVLTYAPPVNAVAAEDESSVVVIGGGKSAQDAAALLANEGRKVTLVCNDLDCFLAYPIPLPAFIRQSRFLAVIGPHIHLRTKLERFLHTTWLGMYIVRFFWWALFELSFLSVGVKAGSPLRNTVPPFWSIRLNDEGVPRENAFYGLAVSGKINVITPARVARFGEDGGSVVLEDGRVLRASAIILATGYLSSWDTLFDKTMDELGLGPQPANAESSHRWEYTTLSNPPPTHPDTRRWSSAIYCGLVPAKNIMDRDLAMNGTCLSINNGYTTEIASHWISSYFLGDDMRLPHSVDAALAETDREAAWLKQRYPQVPTARNLSYMAFLTFATWPQYGDDLLEDMGLRVMRSGGNALTWPFKPVDSAELKTLKEERDVRRASLQRRAFA